MTQSNDDLWRTRFRLFILVRLFGVAVFLLGVAIAYSDLIRPGGWLLVGGLVALMGGLDAVFAPRMLKKLWELQDADGGRR